MLDSPEDYNKGQNNLLGFRISVLSSIELCKSTTIKTIQGQNDETRKALLQIYRDFQDIELKIVSLKGESND